MAMIIYNYENRLIVCNEDACAIWQHDSQGWTVGTVELARECMMGGTPITRGIASHDFPGVDWNSLPALNSA